MSKTEAKQRNGIFEVLKAVILALIFSLVLILLASLIVKFANIETNYLPIINQVIKGVSILCSCLLCLKTPSGGWVKGIIIGLLYIALAYVLFSLLNGKFVFDLSLVNDLAIGSVSGLISGIISVNIRK